MNPHKLVHILEEKNKSLEEFYSLGRQRLSCFQKGDFRQLKSFYLSRERLLQNISQLDGEIESLTESYNVGPKKGTSIGSTAKTGPLPVEASATSAQINLDPALRSQIVQLQQVRRHWITKIVWQDLRMLGFVEKAKSKIIYNLQSSQKTNKMQKAS